MLSNPLTKTATLLATWLQGVSSSPTLSARQSTTPFTIEPFLQFSTSLGVQLPTSDIRSAFGRFQQTKTSNFSGVVSGTIPLLELQVTYAGNTSSFLDQQSFGTLFGIFNTTDGAPLSMSASGPTQPIGSAQQAGLKVVRFATLQTKNPKYAYLNEMSFLAEVCGGQQGPGLEGMGMFYSVKSTQECSLPGMRMRMNASGTMTAAA